MEIVRVAVDHHGPPDHIPDPEPAGQDLQMGCTVAAEQWGQIPRVLGMGQLAGVKVVPGIGKALSPAVAALVDMEREESGFGFWQATDIGCHQGAVGLLVEFHRTLEPRLPADPGHCSRPVKNG